MTASPYPKPTVVEDWIHIKPRELLPILSHRSQTKPPLPSPPRQPSFASEYSLSTHIVPAVSPRSSPKLPRPREALPGESKEDRQARIGETVELVLTNRRKYEAGEFGSETDDRPLWIVANRYVHRNALRGHTKGLTLFLAHANGFPKETWEPTIQCVLDYAEDPRRTAIQVDEIWAWEAVQHGDSALLNAENLGGLYDWSDNSRDILNFFLHYLPTEIHPGQLPVHLTPIHETEASQRKVQGIPGRTIIGVGHSFGGVTITRAALAYPAIFADLILIDPPIAARYGGDAIIDPVVYAAVSRRATWPSRENAAKLLKESTFFSAWDPAVLNLYLECGMIENPDGSVRLKMTGEQEGILYEQRTAREVFELLEHLDPRIELRWIMPTRSSVFGSEEWQTEIKVWRRPVNCSNVRLEAGHLMVQENPKELGYEIHKFISDKYGACSAPASARL
ncbi:hypothetical protein PUNSTDRAFT_96391 [Punctularia strigosozonata HHB-11173 SS5]|uniref:uncharacterized protein n=1 Tax=Punctularia strigosozonata (strain HHB-11173) TaxID=741275 RepID=UPI00044180C2|nr:uncharacterized protein PUNSTDRAFT_96391 [Punctularia strigosozonata HHB-11173 SS5]EIN14480.1 hypothetical protein PUNSTDRAFT_96391 [Punctularia strigosozonata HHB-11173 SS5]